jgi:4-amino-4-deoxy-L-arabinose transferase-like glycosyltransferase
MKTRTFAVLLGLTTLWGAVLRILYFIVTPYYMRTYDSADHIQYILYVARTFLIPPVYTGWETHQPPLYYFLVAGWVRLGMLLGRTTEMLSFDVRLFSLLLSLATMALIVWIALILFSAPRERWKAGLFVFIAGTLPAIVMFSTRISNDVLAVPLSFLWCAFLLRWWKSNRAGDLHAAGIVLGLGILTKLPFALLLPAMGICILLREYRSPKKCISHLAILACTIIVISGWYFFLRSSEYIGLFLVPTTFGLNKGLVVGNSVFDYVLFNPLSVFHSPFAAPWGAMSDKRYIWEYFFKSAFFGEWVYPSFVWTARATLVAGMIGIAAALAGIVRDWRSGVYRWPLALIAACLMGSLMFHRFLHPCACSQDFRYIPLFIVPFLVWVLAGFGALGKRGPMWAWIWAIVFVSLQTAFLLSFSIPLPDPPSQSPYSPAAPQETNNR